MKTILKTHNTFFSFFLQEEQVKSETTAYITAHADGTYIPDSSMPYYCPYPYPDQGKNI